MQSLLHTAIIMDGNGRWAEARGWPRARGHAAGAEALRKIVEAAPSLGIGTLTVYAFSSDNWQRPPEEVQALMELFAAYLASEREPLRRAGVRCTAVGRRDRLPESLVTALEHTEAATRACSKLWLRLAIDYSARGEIARAAAAAATRWTAGLPPSAELMQRLTASALEREAGPVDLLIRTGGERRLSDFVLWEAAYAELLFLRVAWPDFRPAHLRRALHVFGCRQRRFGALLPAAAGASA